MSAVESRAFGPASHRGAAAASPCLAAHVWIATTATASSSRTTCVTPGTALAFASSTLVSLPPKVGDAATTANLIPRRRTSMPNFAVPFTFPAVSMRRCALPHLYHWHDERNPARSIDAKECIGRERRVLRYAVAHFAACRQAEANDEPAANCGGGGELEKIPARRRNVHLAASLIAARMRGYVPQRQMLPAIALSISASLGLAFEARSALADMI